MPQSRVLSGSIGAASVVGCFLRVCASLDASLDALEGGGALPAHFCSHMLDPAG